MQDQTVLRKSVTQIFEQHKNGTLALDDAVTWTLTFCAATVSSAAQQYVTTHPMNSHMRLTDDTPGGGLCAMLTRWLFMLLHFTGWTAIYLFTGIWVIVVFAYSGPIFMHVGRFLWQYM